MSLFQAIIGGGFAIFILFGCSILSLAIIIERCFYYKSRSKVKRRDFMDEISAELKRDRLMNALDICENTKTPFSSVVHAGLKLFGHNESVISNAMEREVTIETTKLEQYTSVVGTIASTAVYIGLFGTVLGIIRAFHDIAQNAGSGGMNVVINGIAEALICTAAGLCVAVPAVIAYNYFIKRIDKFVVDMDLVVSETMDLIATKHR